MTTWLLIGSGGFLGAITRFGLGGWAQARFGGDVRLGAFPWGTMVVNLVGCLIAGVLIAWFRSVSAESNSDTAAKTMQFALIGFVGALTTFSAFGIETFDLLSANRYGAVALSLGVNVIGGVSLVAAGWFLYRTFAA